MYLFQYFDFIYIYILFGYIGIQIWNLIDVLKSGHPYFQMFITNGNSKFMTRINTPLYNKSNPESNYKVLWLSLIFDQVQRVLCYRYRFHGWSWVCSWIIEEFVPDPLWRSQTKSILKQLSKHVGYTIQPYVRYMQQCFTCDSL